MSLKKTIYVFTSTFPCDEHGEIYLWDELPHLTNAFDFVYFLPQNGTFAIKSLPENCFVIPPPIINKQKLSISLLLKLLNGYLVILIY